MDSITIKKPESGRHIEIARSEEGTQLPISIGFNVYNEVGVGRDGNDLIFTFLDDSSIKIEDFFVTDGEELPLFILEDGTQVASSGVLQTLDGNIDITTAAGPASSPASGGVNAYEDMGGEGLLGGYAGMDSLEGLDGIGEWSRSGLEDGLMANFGVLGGGALVGEPDVIY